MIAQIAILLGSIFILSWLSSSLIKTLISIAQYLRWREFLVGFFIMGLSASLTDLFFGISAVLQNLGPLSFGDVIGGNLVDLTLVMALVVFFTKKGIATDSKMIIGSSIFTFFIALLPIVLIWDGNVTRLKGLILIATFFAYSFWLFSEDGKYKKVYKNTANLPKNSSYLIKNLVKLVAIISVLLLASQGLIFSAKYFSLNLGLSLSMVGILIIGLGNSFPEMYFGIISARNNEGWMVIGDMMGSVVFSATMVLGTIALIHPFQIQDMRPFFLARIFTVAAASFFLLNINSSKKFTKKEGVSLLFLYIAFLIAEAVMH